MARRSTALAVRWAAVAATLVVVGVVALTTAAAGAPPPSARAGVPAACVKTRTCACVYPPGAPADAPDAACTLRKCVTCPCARGGACTSALVLPQHGDFVCVFAVLVSSRVVHRERWDGPEDRARRVVAAGRRR